MISIHLKVECEKRGMAYVWNKVQEETLKISLEHRGDQKAEDSYRE